MALLRDLIVGAALLVMFYALAKQLGNPSGWFGRAVMPSFLNLGNRTILNAAVRALGAKSGERIADVGFGGGYVLQLIAPMVKPLRVTGVEISDAMIAAAKHRWGDAIEVHRADAQAMPFRDGWFDGVVSVNTIYFWNDPTAVLREFRRVLKPGGRLVLGIQKKEIMRWAPVTWFGFRLYSVPEIERMLDAAGFQATIQQTTGGVAKPQA